MLKKVGRALLIALLVMGIVQVALAAWPTGKQPYTKYINVPRVMPRMWCVTGAAANTSIYVADLRPSDEIFSVWFCDTTTATKFTWRDDTAVSYYQANDSLRDTLPTDTGFLIIMGHDANPMNPDLEVTRSRVR